MLCFAPTPMLKTVEIPLTGHADKICDQIVDMIVDEYLRKDKKSSLDIQALGSHGMIMIGGAIDSRADFDVSTLVKKAYQDIGYTDEIEPFINIEKPSEDMGRVMVQGGAQGTTHVHGYATKETREFLPKAYVYAVSLARRIEDLRKNDAAFSWLGPDGKVQVTLDKNRPVAITILVQHHPSIDVAQVKMAMLEYVVKPVIGTDEEIQILINPGGSFQEGGFAIGAGSSGRKVLADTYGGLLPGDGHAMSGKDPSKPSRAGMYMARFAAKSLVARGVAGNVLVKAAYTLGKTAPVYMRGYTGAGEDITDIIEKEFDFRIPAIVERLDLSQPLYRAVSVYGQFGRDGMPWEDVEKDAVGSAEIS